MPPVSHHKRLVDFLTNESTRPTRSATVDHLSSLRSMTRQQAEAAIDRAIAAEADVRVAPGGRLIYWDTEQASGANLYSTVGRVIEKHWGRKREGLRDINVVRPPHGRTPSEGVWTRPDLVMAALPRRRRSPTAPKDIHALEVERHSGLGIQSVYQAYEQARGAHFAWVFAHAFEVDPRVKTAAEELGIGLVTFSNPNSFATYDTVVRAELRGDGRKPPPAPEAFMKRCFPKGTTELNGWEPPG